jgi:prophage regulatory protein
MESQTMKLLDYEGLADKGIKFSDTHIGRLINKNQFPRPVKIGKRSYWIEEEINQYIADKLKQRDGAAA